MAEEYDVLPPEPFWRFWEAMAVCALILGMVGIGIYASATEKTLTVFGILGLLALAAWMGGAVIGFLFGVPRFQSGQTSATQSGFVHNTNLEQISDWLTKIIIGATLVQIKDITSSIGALCTQVGNQISSPGAATVVGGVILFFFFTGFMWGYLWCSLRIFREMAQLSRLYPRLTG